MDAQELINTLQNQQDQDALYATLCSGVQAIDDRGRDLLWNAMKAKADELTRSDIQGGERMANWMIELADQIISPRHRALGLLALGNVHSIGLGAYRQAVDCYNAAADIYQRLGLPVEEAQSQIGKIYALSNLGQYQQAIADGERASRVLEAHGAWMLLARLLVNLAILRGRQGQDGEALSLLDRASRVYDDMGPEVEVHRLRVELNRALLLRNLGRFDEANQANQAVLEAHLAAGRAVDAARARQSLGVTYFLQGRYNEGLAMLEEARATFLGDHRQRHAMLVELFLSDCLLQLRRFDDVLEKCRRVRDLFTELGTRYEVGQAILNEASAFSSLGRNAEAQVSLQEAHRLFEQEGNRAAMADANLQLAGLLLAQGRASESLESALVCERIYAGLDLPVKAARAGLMAARAALACEQVKEAQERAQKALIAGEALFLPDLTFPAQHLLGQVAVMQGDSMKGLAAFEQAIDTLELLRGRLMVEFRADFVEDKSRLYEDAVDLSLKVGAVARGLEFCERAKSRALLDLLSHRVDLSIRAHNDADQPLVDELVSLRNERDILYRRREGGEGYGQRGQESDANQETDSDARVLELEKRITGLWHRLLVRGANYASQAALWQVRTEPVQPYLRPGSLLVEYFSVKGRLVVFLVGQGHMEGIYLPVSITEVQRLIQLFWLNLKSVPRAATAQRAALAANLRGILRRLYTLLVEPFQEAVQNTRHLVIVPHGPLHYLPFQALHDGSRYLLEIAGISYLPGASILRYCREAQPAGQAALALGHSFGSRLPFTVQEAHDIARTLGGQALIEDGATLAALRTAAPTCRVLHLAAHGEFRADNPLFSGVALADGWLTTLEVFNLRLEASLVTLSACHTGRSVVGGGDELLGLMRSFLAAGAASLVTTLWTVEDQSTAQLMSSFYRALQAGSPKGAALNQAQRDLLQSDDYDHPYFWAPFCLVGDEGPL